MIREAEVLPLILRSFPSFSEHLRANPEYFNYTGGLGPYMLASAFAAHVDTILIDGSEAQVEAAIELIETLLRDGEPSVLELARIGIIEDIQTQASWAKERYATFYETLGPLSKNAWREVAVMWEGKTSLAEILRAESNLKVSREDS